MQNVLKKAKQERKLGFWWHYNRAKNMLNTLETSPHFLKAFYENCYTQSIRKIDWIMQKENWQ